MHDRSVIAAAVLAALVLVPLTAAQAFDESKYPDLKGQWDRIGPPRWDDKQAPLTAEYRKIYEANLRDMAQGGQGDDPTYLCISPGMPRIMNVYAPMEIVVTPATTYIMIEHIHDQRRIYTDGREWPADNLATYSGYSIGKWIDTTGSGRYDLLEVETRDLKGPRVFDSTGLPMHEDNQTVINERIYVDKADANLLHDDITVTDHALTRPWTANKTYRRINEGHPVWIESICAETNHHVRVGSEDYFLNENGLLMPTRKDQPPPDLKYFRPAQR
jgi:hypothetical protein